MIDILLFAEDDAQEKFVGTLVSRIAAEYSLSTKLRIRSTRGGYGKVKAELRRFANSCAEGREKLPDIVVVAVDANCRGVHERCGEVGQAGVLLTDTLVVAVADPHIERWFLLDGAAFKSVVGHGCQAPDQKCEKDRYKGLLIKAVVDAGVEPLLGGIEYAEDLAKHMDIKRAANADSALARFVDALRARLDRIKISRKP